MDTEPPRSAADSLTHVSTARVSRWTQGATTLVTFASAVAVSLVVSYALLRLAARVTLRLLVAAVDWCVWLAAALTADSGAQDVMSTLARAASHVLTGQHLSLLLLATATMSALAFYALQRLLRTDAPR